jgi:hypothetical protein
MIPVTRRTSVADSHELDPEALDVVAGREEVEDLDVAIVAGRSADMKDPERLGQAFVVPAHIHTPRTARTTAASASGERYFQKNAIAVSVRTRGLVFLTRMIRTRMRRYFRTPQRSPRPRSGNPPQKRRMSRRGRRQHHELLSFQKASSGRRTP